MWSRSFIIVFALWLIISPYIFQDKSVSDGFYTWNGFLLFFLSGLSAFSKFARVAWLVFGQALFLFFYGRFAFDHPHPPGAQNLVLTSLLTMMMAIIPLKDQQPPHALEKGMLETEV